MCEEDKNIELVQVRTIPVPPATLYQEAISNGSFIGDFNAFLNFMKIKGDPGQDGKQIWTKADW